jgi:hypothetical protein
MKDLIHPINVIKGDYHLYRSNYSISIGSLKSVANNNMLVTIDTEDKIMIVSNNKTMTVMNSPFLLLDSLIKEGQIDIKKLKGSKEPVRSYRFAFGEDTAVDSMDITYNSTTYLMSELKVFYTNASMLGDETEDYKPVVKFQFYDQEIKNHFDKALFDLNQFVTINNKKVVPNASFKNYQFKNYLKL